MSIIGLVLAGLSYICMIAWDNSVDYEAAIGWGVIAVAYLIALSIVGLVKSRKPKEI